MRNLAVVEVHDSFTRPKMSSRIVSRTKRSVRFRNGVFQRYSDRDLSEESLSCRADQAIVSTDCLGGEHNVYTAGTEQTHPALKQIGDLIRDLVSLREHHLKLVHKEDDSRHDSIGILRAILTYTLNARPLKLFHSRGVDRKKIRENCQAELPVGLQS